MQIRTGIGTAAKAFALRKHSRQCRPNASLEPKSVHLAEVASYVVGDCIDETAVACAWLHDIVEDTDTALAEIQANFGKAVSEVVDVLTDPPEWALKELSGRKKLQSERIRTAPDVARLVKLADQISNIRSVLFDPPTDWEPEKRQVYIRGAASVGRACSGVSSGLDARLERCLRIPLSSGGGPARSPTQRTVPAGESADGV